MKDLTTYIEERKKQAENVVNTDRDYLDILVPKDIIDSLITQTAQEAYDIARIDLEEKIRKEYAKDFLAWRQSGLMSYTHEKVEEARKEAYALGQKEAISIVESYFKGLVHIPDPQATAKKLLTTLRTESNYLDVPQSEKHLCEK
jgi:hypothetical protein